MCFVEVCEALYTSPALREYLGCLLACGNYLNGGTKRGQADGFDIEQLGKLDAVKDSQGKDLRHFLGIQLSTGGVFEDIGRNLISELQSLTRQVKRSIMKNSEGVLIVTKQAPCSIEDCTSCFARTQKNLEKHDELLCACLQSGELNETDSMRLEMPNLMNDAKTTVNRAQGLLQSATTSYKTLQTYFNATDLKSHELFLLWDDALFPRDILADPKKVTSVTHQFCVAQPVTYEDFVSLYAVESKKVKRGRTTTWLGKTTRRPRSRVRASSRVRARSRVRAGQIVDEGSDCAPPTKLMKLSDMGT